jgi:lysozyme
MNNKTPSPRAEKLAKSWEKLRLVAYRDGKGVWTLGWGTTSAAIAGLKIVEGMTCTPEQAENWFQAVFEGIARDLNRFLEVDVNQNQFDALTVLCYNVGTPAFHHSKFLERINLGDPKASGEFLDWCYERDPHTGHLVKSDGLENRRKSEWALYNEPLTA